MLLYRCIQVSLLVLALLIPTSGSFAQSMGLAAENARTFRAQCDRYGVCDHARVFYSITDRANRADPLRWVEREYLARNVPVILVLVVHAPDRDRGHNEQILQGAVDRDLRALAQAAVRYQFTGRIVLFHEGNGDWYPWGAYARGNTPESYRRAFAHVAELFREEGAQVTFEMNFNRRSAGTRGVSDFAMVYPGDEWVDVVGVSSYNRCGTNPQYRENRSFREEAEPAFRAIRAITERPLAIAETATSPHCGVDVQDWYADLFTVVTEYHVQDVTFFFLKKRSGEASLTVDTDWAPHHADAFRALVLRERAPVSNGAIQHAPHRESPSLFGEPRFPWSVYGRLDHYLAEEPNTAINLLTNEPFGEIGTRFRLHLHQGVAWDLSDTVTFEPRISLKAVVSSNRDLWWNNSVAIGGELRLCRKASFATWGGMCGFMGVEHLSYTSEAPERYGSGLFGKGGEARAVIGLEFNLGGEW